MRLFFGKRIWIFLSFFLVFYPFWLGAEEEQKIYINPTQIGFSQKEIFVRIEDFWVPVKAIHSDENGLYFLPLP